MKVLEVFDGLQSLVAPRRHYALSYCYGMDWFMGDLFVAVQLSC